jgi:hypothetical protein
LQTVDADGLPYDTPYVPWPWLLIGTGTEPVAEIEKGRDNVMATIIGSLRSLRFLSTSTRSYNKILRLLAIGFLQTSKVL